MHINTLRRLFCALVLSASASVAFAQTSPGAPGRFLFGGDYPMNPSEQVKALFYESGLNCIRLTGGGYSWSVEKQKALADEFQQRGLYVYLQLGSHYPSADYFKLKDAWFVDQDGKTGEEDRKAWSITYSGQHWPQYSYTSAAFRQQLEGDFTKYLAGFAGNTNVAGVILHNEPGFFWLGDRVFDYNPQTIAAFRVWLQKQHRDIATLNTRWHTEYKSFDEVTPPGKPPVEKIGAWMDWRRFSAASIAEFMSWESTFFRKQRGDVPRTTNLSGPLDHWFGYRCADNYQLSLPMDAVGIDIYPTQWSDRVFVPYAMDLSSGVAAGRDVHVLETDVFSGGTWKKYDEAQRANMLRGELWTEIGHGARAVLMWGFSRGDEFSLTNGEKNERYEAVREIAGQLRMIGIDNFRRPRAQVAVCVDPDNYIYAAGLEEKPNSLSPAEDADAHGMYAMLADSGIQADVIFTKQLHPTNTADSALSGYKAIVLAGAQFIDPAMGTNLELSALSGSIIIADEPLATRDRWGNELSQPGLPGLKPQLKNVVRLGNRAGTAYMNKPDSAVRERVASAIAPLLSGPRVRASEPSVNVSLLQDGRGNLLVTATTLGSKGEIAPEVPDLKLTITGTNKLARAVLLWSKGEKLFQDVQLMPEGNALTISVGRLTSAAPILLVREGDPLLNQLGK